MKRILFALAVLCLPAAVQAAKVKEAVGVVGTYDSTVVNRNGATVGGVIPSFSQVDSTGAAADLGTVLRSSTGTKSNVTSVTSSATLLAANASRKGATIYNDSTAILYVDLSGGTASSSSYSVQMAAATYYEVPFGYTGLITGIWASVNGAARITELQ